MSKVILESIITYPECGAKKKELMPTDAYQYFYECTSCHKILKPLAGDCCVYCSFSTVKCPLIQENGAYCS